MKPFDPEGLLEKIARLRERCKLGLGPPRPTQDDPTPRAILRPTSNAILDKAVLDFEIAVLRDACQSLLKDLDAVIEYRRATTLEEEVEFFSSMVKLPDDDDPEHLRAYLREMLSADEDEADEPALPRKND